MCITFFYINPVKKPNEFSFILAFNRDEFFGRLTEEASFQDEILAGRDLTDGKVGGTWLAIGKNGKFSMLTNVYTGLAQQVCK